MPITFKVADKTPEPCLFTKLQKQTTHATVSSLPESHYLASCIEYKKENCGRILQQSEWDAETSIACNNGFVYAATNAYNGHHNLVLRPDDVWIAITTQFASYVNGNAEELRKHFVHHEGKKALVVSQTATLGTADYAKLSEQMVTELRKNIKDASLVDWILPKFTTTHYNDTIVGSIVFMSSMKKYFEMKFMLLCGLPQVTLLGTPEDWKQICGKVSYLEQFGGVCSKWVKMLGPVVQKIYESSLGEIDVNFWQRICHNTGGGSGPRYLSGWITVFCVFNDKGIWQGDVPNDDKDYIKIDTNNIPPGYATVPIAIDDNGTEHKALMFAGHMTKTCIDDTTLAPQLSWAIVLKNL